MLKDLPSTPEGLIAWSWPEMAPYYQGLASCSITASNMQAWLEDWTSIGERVEELHARLSVATSINTADKAAEERMHGFLDNIFPNALAAEQKLKEKLLASQLEPPGFELPLRKMRAEADLFRSANLPLLAEQQKLAIQYDRIFGAQTVDWEGEEITLARLARNFQQPDRRLREKAWRLKAARQLADAQVINELWAKFMDVRARIAENAGKPSFREYAWQQKLRFDYTPDDCKSFASAIEQVVVPAASRIYEKHKKNLGLVSMRPWDLVDGWYSRPTETAAAPTLKPFASIDELKQGISNIFHQLDPQLGGYFDSMLAEGLTDLANRKNKAPGAYCSSFISIRKPFVFVNAIGTQEDVITTLHESGHAFHIFETAGIPYIQELSVPMEFAEVASIGMELLASPYLTRQKGGFYSEPDAARARIEHLEGLILFWPFMAVVDTFQHWVYENPAKGANPADCNAKWGELWDRFLPGVDWSGLEQVKQTGWHRKLHIHQLPFYYVEYGLAQLGGVQLFGNAIKNQAGAVAAYRKALALGGTVSLPQLFATAGARFAFDSATLRTAVGLLEKVVGELEEEI
ncbi:MAG: M3 family oligoendopeptidase [Anaerolineales bacterium]|jgi:oligoendopeptidase F